MNCIIVIPVYSTDPNQVEIASFRQVLTLLKNYNISLITFEGLDLSNYQYIAQECNKQYSIEFFDKKFFTSVAGYNKLCLSKDFYLRFSDYRYMLIYQLDAYVFNDNLEFWINKNYDYVGAPTFYSTIENGQIIHTTDFEGVGNGGLSLRKISHCLRVLNSPKHLPYLSPAYLYKLYSFNRTNSIKALTKTLLRSLGYRNTLHYFLKSNRFNEDYIFSLWAENSNTIKGVYLPIPVEAAQFSFEHHPTYLFSLIKKLPFGCHAFKKYEFDCFWSKYINIK